MNLTRLTLAGFRSFKQQHTVSFDSGAVFVLGSNLDDPAFDSNGGGKTTLCAAIPWGLYGALSTDARKDGVIHRGSDRADVELRFGDALHVRRSKKRGEPEVLSFWHEGRWHEGDLAATQEKLAAVIGVSQALFFNSLWIDAQSKSVQFLWAAPGKRLEILEELMADGVYTAARSRAEVRRKELEAQRSYAKGKIETLMSHEERERQALNRARAELAQATLNNRARLQKQNQRQVELRVEIGRLQAEMDAIATGESPDAILARIQRLEHEAAQVRARIAAIPLPPRLPEAGTECPTCLQGIPQAHVHAVLARSEEGIRKRDELARTEQALQEEVRKARTAKQDHETTAASRRNMERVMSGLTREMASLADAPTTDPFVQSLEQTIEEAKDAIDGIQKNIHQHEQILHDCNQRIPLYKFWETGFGSRGVRSLLLDDVRAVLAYHADQYTRALAGDQLRVEFPAGDKGFEVLVHTPEGVADLSTFSRGEAWRANLSVLLALRKTLASLNATRLSLLVLDDPCGDLDDSGVRAVVSTVRGLAEEFGTVLVTLPRQVDNIPDDAIIRVEKRQGVSTLVEVEE